MAIAETVKNYLAGKSVDYNLVNHLHTVKLAVKKLSDRQVAATIIHGYDDFVSVQLFDKTFNTLAGEEFTSIFYDLAVSGCGNHADNLEPSAIGFAT